METCKCINGELHPCARLWKWMFNNQITNVSEFKSCPFCQKSINENSSHDPWLYENAIIEIVYKNGERKCEYYTGQDLKRHNWCVRGTPWEMVGKEVNEIYINPNGLVVHDGVHCYLYKFEWINCPDSLKSVNNIYIRPEWTKFLPGAE